MLLLLLLYLIAYTAKFMFIGMTQKNGDKMMLKESFGSRQHAEVLILDGNSKGKKHQSTRTSD